MALARDAATRADLEARARAYDEWYAGTGQFASPVRPGWNDEVAALVALVATLPEARTLDVPCATGFLTRHLHGLAVGLDRSPAMVELAQSRLRHGVAVLGDALALPFAARAFDRVLTAQFFGDLAADERRAFLAEARRVAPELLVVDAARRPADLVAELGGGEVLLDGAWFVAVRSTAPE